MIRVCTEQDIGAMVEIINGSARAYEGHIPEDCYHQPYMPEDELRSEIADGVTFYGFQDGGRLVAVMGIQDKGPVVLIRHAYTKTEERSKGIGSRLLSHLLGTTAKPVLVGTWRDAIWAIRFYQKRGFRLVSTEEKDALLRALWSISQRQVETSVVLVDAKYDKDLAFG